MEKKIHLISLDDVWNKMEYKIIDLLHHYDCLENIDKDSKYLMGRYLLKYLLRRITTCSIDFEHTSEGLLTYLSTNQYPFVVFYVDMDKITRDKEILEYISYNDFIKIFKELVRDFNQVLNYRIIYCKFPYDEFTNIEMGEITKTPSELALKVEILLQFYQKKRVDLKRVQKIAKRYSIELDELKIRKITS